MDMQNMWKGVKTVVSHPAVTGAMQGALAAYVTDVSKRRSGKGMSLLAGIGIGAAVGAGLVFFFATERGKDLRAKLMKAAGKAPSVEGHDGGKVRNESSKPDGVPMNNHSRKNHAAGEPTS